MNTHITNIKGDWQEVVDTCRATSGKGPLGHEPSEDFKRRILIAEHSPIRRISVSWVWQGMRMPGDADVRDVCMVAEISPGHCKHGHSKAV